MALDEALLEAAPRLGQPVLRFYGWTEPAATFGYFQRYAEVTRANGWQPLLRRPTGGGLVPHVSDWTYSFTVPAGHEWHGLRAEPSYQRMHEWLADAFVRLGIATELASCCRKTIPGQCFAGYEKFDLLWGGRKLAGAAQRRTRTGLLIQGSVQPPPLAPAKVDWQQALCDVGQVRWNVRWRELELDSALRERAEVLVATKYARPDYNQRR